MQVWSMASWDVLPLPTILASILTVFVDVYLEKKERILGGEAGVFLSA